MINLFVLLSSEFACFTSHHKMKLMYVHTDSSVMFDGRLFCGFALFERFIALLVKAFSNYPLYYLTIFCNINCIIVLRDRQAGGYDFCKPEGANFIPRGEAPRDEMAPKGLQKSYASQSAITQLYCYGVY